MNNNKEMIIATISAIASAVSAIMAFITTIQNKKANEKIDEERHAMVRPNFVVTGVTENRIERKYKIQVLNIGYNVLNDIAIRWEGNKKADLEMDKYVENDKTLTYEINIRFDKENNNIKKIEGELTLIYTDILGKQYNKSIKLIFNEIYNDLSEIYYLVLENINGKEFRA